MSVPCVLQYATSKHSPLFDMASFAGCKWVAVAGEPATLRALKTSAYVAPRAGDPVVGDLCGLARRGCDPEHVLDILRVCRTTPHMVTAVVLRVRRVATIVEDDFHGELGRDLYHLCVPADETDEKITFRRTERGWTNGNRILMRAAHTEPRHMCLATEKMQAKFDALPAEGVAYAPEND